MGVPRVNRIVEGQRIFWPDGYESGVISEITAVGSRIISFTYKRDDTRDGQGEYAQVIWKDAKIPPAVWLH